MMHRLPVMLVAAVVMSFSLLLSAPVRACFISGCSAESCAIDNNLSDTVKTFVGRRCKASVRTVMPGSMWDKTVREVKDNRSKDDDCKTAWKLISRDEDRK